MNFLEFGGILFWIFIGAVIVALLFTIELQDSRDKEVKGTLGWPTLILIAAGATMYYCNQAQTIEWLLYTKAHIGLLLYKFGAYIVFGIGWSFFKWWKLVKRAHKRYLKDKAEYQDALKSGYKSATLSSITSYIPKPSKWKGALTSWILFWPLSILRYAFGELLGDFVNTIVRNLNGIYSAIALKAFGDSIRAEEEAEEKRQADIAAAKAKKAKEIQD